jgi:pimeloyl-ACP methyl ester carboxylesterase
MKVKVICLAISLIMGCISISHCQPSNKSVGRINPGIVSEERLENLLVCPPCLESYSRTAESYSVEKVTIPGADIELSGKLYLPEKPGPYPAIVFLHGGGNNYDLLMSSPRYYAARLAHCGYAALIYDKRGTGESGGVFHESTYGDYISDAGHAADFLVKHEQIDPNKIGVYGGSQGGRLAPLVAVRFPGVSFAVSASGPIGTLADQATFNMEYALGVRGYEDSTIKQVMPLWRKHHAACESLDPDEMNEVAGEIFRLREFIDPMALPNTRHEFLTDSNLFFLRPTYFSMSRDYVSELADLGVPWLAIYGQQDPIINVPESIENIEEQMATAGNTDYEIIVIKDVGHSFDNRETGKEVPIVNIVINWLEEILSN